MFRMLVQTRAWDPDAYTAICTHGWGAGWFQGRAHWPSDDPPSMKQKTVLGTHIDQSQVPATNCLKGLRIIETKKGARPFSC